ncbi:putative multifunctional pol protein [Cestrum yellow leaf curling virus]|uniref:Enzymatic polyprotein n=1 Tax=Cestrum yellow leaf curling virus TaxID=175814 RepID=POL_CYLCV|nr:putative multifunctional pol protein [Cestrum yellow leaf curling virus]Q7TD08.1 RecName: Full=Enzymatic polyprotein; Includes: RecName: Full=Aspartic protease; Includes: RecName: Full=Endonuclease; Includes: RecName: Full=Reverse transcriptase [Cestrum yellow leaf curling virus]AAP78924.1 putative multifunctional pol protein [Cestrum yellow leaf curling virus]
MKSKGNPNATFITVKINDVFINAYVDTGATICLADPKIKLKWVKMEKPIKISIADKSVQEIWHRAEMVEIWIRNYKFVAATVCQKSSGMDFVIGNNFLRLYQPFIQGLNYIKLRAPLDKDINQPSKMIYIPVTTPSKILQFAILEKLQDILFELHVQENSKTPLELKVSSTLEEVCDENPLDVKNTNTELVKIELINPEKEVNVPNNIPYSLRDINEFSQECADLVRKGIIEESKSPHSAPAFYVENHNEIKRKKRRMVINYKALNKATIGNAHKLPRIDSILTKVKGSNWFSTLDAKSGYWQLRLHPQSKPLTAFSCPPQKHYQWNVLPFGLKQAPGIYQNFMDKNLEGLENFCLAYIDDILVFTNSSREEHLSKLLVVLERCKEKGLILSKKKAIIARQTIDFLGLTLQENGEIKLQPNVLEKLELFPDAIEDRKQLQRFLGCLNYIADKGFLKEIAKETKNLYPKVSITNPWHWSDLDSKLVNQIKKKCKDLSPLYFPKPEDYLIIETDASGDTWAGCLKAAELLFPKGTKNKVVERLCKYTSGIFSSAEQKYTVHEKETLAALKTMRKWKAELLPKEFTLRTDSSYVTGFARHNLKANYNQGRLVRWQLEFLQYPARVEYIKGEKNSLADTLTREWKQQ